MHAIFCRFLPALFSFGLTSFPGEPPRQLATNHYTPLQTPRNAPRNQTPKGLAAFVRSLLEPQRSLVNSQTGSIVLKLRHSGRCR